jgi:hypothetical protein
MSNPGLDETRPKIVICKVMNSTAFVVSVAEMKHDLIEHSLQNEQNARHSPMKIHTWSLYAYIVACLLVMYSTRVESGPRLRVINHRERLQALDLF